MKTFRSKFLAIIAAIFVASVVAPQVTPAKALDIGSCQKYVDSLGLGNSAEWSNFYDDHPHWRVYPSGPTIHVAVAGYTCSKMTEPIALVFLESDPSVSFRLKLGGPFTSMCRETSNSYSIRYFDCVWWFEIDPELENMPDGTYGVVHGGSVDGDGYTTPFRRSLWGNPAHNSFVLKKVDPPSTTTTNPPPPINVPEVLEDELTAVVPSGYRDAKLKRASVIYTVTVRCSPICGKLPSEFATRLCEGPIRATTAQPVSRVYE